MKRFKHSLSHYNLTTAEMGTLFPVSNYEVLPGDTIQQHSSALVRITPQQAPVMHPVQVRLHTFFVPYRLLWDGWEDFITGKDPDATPPKIIVAGNPNQLPDYLGLNPTAGGQTEVNSLPIRAYNMIYNEFYRDQDLVDEAILSSTAIQNVAWGKDYFTAARPWSQKGPDITLPLGQEAPLFIDDDTQGNTQASGWDADTDSFYIGQDYSADTTLKADLSNATAVDVNDVRKAFALQRYEEARARYGSRYTEYLRYLGVTPSDSRLQRPEYLGGGTQTINFSEVLQTAQDDQGAEQTPVGTLRGHGISAIRSRRFRRFFEEHGIVITLMSVRPKSIYQEGFHRQWLRQTKEDYFQKELEAIGQQEVFNAELYQPANSPTDFGVFGYTDRYREYREHPSGVSGEFRNILDYWHMARQFDDTPVLNQSFTDCVPTKRIYAEQTQNPLWIMTNHSVKARRMVNRSAHSKIV